MYVCVCERWAGGVKFGCLNQLGKVAASASLLLTWKMWKHSPPHPYVDEAMESLFSGISFVFCFCFLSLILLILALTLLTPAPLVRLHNG